MENKLYEQVYNYLVQLKTKNERKLTYDAMLELYINSRTYKENYDDILKIKCSFDEELKEIFANKKIACFVYLNASLDLTNYIKNRIEYLIVRLSHKEKNQ